MAEEHPSEGPQQPGVSVVVLKAAADVVAELLPTPPAAGSGAAASQATPRAAVVQPTKAAADAVAELLPTPSPVAPAEESQEQHAAGFLAVLTTQAIWDHQASLDCDGRGIIAAAASGSALWRSGDADTSKATVAYRQDSDVPKIPQRPAAATAAAEPSPQLTSTPCADVGHCGAGLPAQSGTPAAAEDTMDANPGARQQPPSAEGSSRGQVSGGGDATLPYEPCQDGVVAKVADETLAYDYGLLPQAAARCTDAAAHGCAGLAGASTLAYDSYHGPQKSPANVAADGARLRSPAAASPGGAASDLLAMADATQPYEPFCGNQSHQPPALSPPHQQHRKTSSLAALAAVATTSPVKLDMAAARKSFAAAAKGVRVVSRPTKDAIVPAGAARPKLAVATPQQGLQPRPQQQPQQQQEPQQRPQQQPQQRQPQHEPQPRAQQQPQQQPPPQQAEAVAAVVRASRSSWEVVAARAGLHRQVDAGWVAPAKATAGPRDDDEAAWLQSAKRRRVQVSSKPVTEEGRATTEECRAGRQHEGGQRTVESAHGTAAVASVWRQPPPSLRASSTEGPAAERQLTLVELWGGRAGSRPWAQQPILDMPPTAAAMCR